ncbi:MAG: septation protein A [Hyphomicrobiales bacterium]
MKKPEVNPILKFALELGPLLVFFFVNSRGEKLAESFPILARFGEPIFMATGLFMVAMVISLTVSLILTKTVPIMPLVTLVVVLIFGGLTLYLQDEVFIKMKPTIVNVIFGSALFIGLFYGKLVLKYVFGAAFKLKEEGWEILTKRWGMFFFFLAILNEVVWRNYSTDFWVAFKVWGTMPITMVFAIVQMGIVTKYALPEEDDEQESQPAD